MGRLGRWLPWVVVLGAAVWLRGPVVEGGFYSEDYAIVERVHRLGPVRVVGENVTVSYMGYVEPFYRPLLGALFAAEATAFGPHPLPYHLVSLALLLGAGLLVGCLARRYAGLPCTHAAACTLLFLLLPVFNEPVGWTVAGQNELLLVFWGMLALVLAAQGSFWSLAAALAAYGTKASGFSFGPVLLLVVLLGTTTAGRRRALILAGAHVAVALAAYGVRTAVVGLRPPYEAASRKGLVARMADGLPHLPGALEASVGWPALAGLGILLLVGLVGLAVDAKRTPRARLTFLMLTAGVLAAGIVPVLPLDLAHVTRTAHGRTFAPQATWLLGLGILLLPRTRAARRLALCVLVLAAAFSAPICREVQGHYLAATARATRGVKQIATIPGEHLLVARLPPGLHWSYPAAARPPFQEPGRLVYPLRRGVSDAHDRLALRPLPSGLRVVDLSAGRAVAVTELDNPQPGSGPRLQRKGAGHLALADLPRPARDLPTIIVPPASPHAVLEGHVRARIRPPGGGVLVYRIPFATGAGAPAVIPLQDIPTWPRAELLALAVHGAETAHSGPPFTGRLQLEDPPPGSVLRLADAGRTFAIRGLPPEARGLVVTLFSAAGAYPPIAVPGRTFSFGTLQALTSHAPLDIWGFLKGGQAWGGDTFWIMVEAVADPEAPDTRLGRAPLAPYVIRLE